MVLLAVAAARPALLPRVPQAPRPQRRPAAFCSTRRFRGSMDRSLASSPGPPLAARRHCCHFSRRRFLPLVAGLP